MTGFMGPPGACDACGRCCSTLHEVGNPCFHCHQGVFMGRRWWRFWQDEFGTWLGVPREDIDPAELAAEWRLVEERQARHGIPKTDHLALPQHPS